MRSLSTGGGSRGVRADVDVAVIGAGPAGSATALRLARRGCRVALIERTEFTAPRVGESLVPAVQPALAELGVWREFTALHPLPSYGTRSLWGEATPQEHSHVVNPYGNGWHVDRLAFDRMLAQAAAGAGAELRCGTTLVDCALADHAWRLRLHARQPGHGAPRSQEIRARVLVDATGRSARVARRLGAKPMLFDRLVGIAALFGGIDTEHEGFLLLQTTSQGWWYSAPVPRRGIVAVLMTDADLCGQARLFTEARWHELLSEASATSARLTGTRLWGPRVFSAASQRLRRRERDAPWIAVGDAALAVDPVSGSGVLRALKSARAGAETALALLDGEASQAVPAYETDRDRECTTYLHGRGVYYGLEQRWQDSAFWRRRALQRNDRSAMVV